MRLIGISTDPPPHSLAVILVSAAGSVPSANGTISVRECLALGPRHVVRLSQSAGEDLQVVVGDVPVARAEVVIVEDSTGVRVTDMIKPSPTEER